LDSSLPQRLPTAGKVIRFVRMQLARALTQLSSRPFDGRYGIEHLFKDPGVVHIRCRERDRQRNALSFDQDMVFSARFASIRRIRAGRVAPLYVE
jgi:hypothetical protein